MRGALSTKRYMTSQQGHVTPRTRTKTTSYYLNKLTSPEERHSHFEFYIKNNIIFKQTTYLWRSRSLNCCFVEASGITVWTSRDSLDYLIKQAVYKGIWPKTFYFTIAGSKDAVLRLLDCAQSQIGTTNWSCAYSRGFMIVFYIIRQHSNKN